MLIGYARVSTQDQNLSLQKETPPVDLQRQGVQSGYEQILANGEFEKADTGADPRHMVERDAKPAAAQTLAGDLDAVEKGDHPIAVVDRQEQSIERFRRIHRELRAAE